MGIRREASGIRYQLFVWLANATPCDHPISDTRSLSGVPMPVFEFWYEFASTYSYPAAMRVEKVAGANGVTVRWRSFLLGPIFGARGWNDSPFNIYPEKGRNMWRDLERICSDLDIPLKQPPFRFPQSSLKAARIALAHEKE